MSSPRRTSCSDYSHDSSDKLVCCATSERVSIHHDQKDGSEFSDVTLASEDDNDNSDVIVVKKLEKFTKRNSNYLLIN